MLTPEKETPAGQAGVFMSARTENRF